MKEVFAPGCALLLYKPALADKTMSFLREYVDSNMKGHMICCRHEPRLENDTKVINTCPGCDRRFRGIYEGVSTISLWEVIAECKTFPFPNYNGMEMSVHDACPTRTEERVHNAIRKLLAHMNIRVVEPENTRHKASCCGDSFYDSLPVERVHERMRIRANEMPREDVVVYCLDCVRSMSIGGKKPHYILDLLFNEEIIPDELTPESWRDRLNDYIEKH